MSISSRIWGLARAAENAQIDKFSAVRATSSHGLARDSGQDNIQQHLPRRARRRPIAELIVIDAVIASSSIESHPPGER